MSNMRALAEAPCAAWFILRASPSLFETCAVIAPSAFLPLLCGFHRHCGRCRSTFAVRHRDTRDVARHGRVRVTYGRCFLGDHRAAIAEVEATAMPAKLARARERSCALQQGSTELFNYRAMLA
jgi:hypothetical protein